MNFERTTDVADLGDAIGKSQDLRKLSLVGNSKGLRYFRVMDYLGLRAAGIQALSDGLKKNRSIESLDITDNGVDAQGARVLSYALQGHPSLNRLSLAGNSIGMEGAKITIERLCSNDSRLVIIDLSGNNIGSLSDQIFVPVIESNKTLKELHISENKILDTAMISILQALTVNTTITGFSCARKTCPSIA
ncbi:hypothetical protein DFJ73DRAFT_175188 [Zopfochytrium polystomum]|nr:hypothetical protein DFJ73DRAFT_175188 [Zopfochytrium polystomum]